MSMNMGSAMSLALGKEMERRVTMTIKLQQVMPPLSDEGSGCNTDPSPSSGSAGAKLREKPQGAKINQYVDPSLPDVPGQKGEDGEEN